MTLQPLVKHKEFVVKDMPLFAVDILMTLEIVAYKMDLRLSVMSSRGLCYVYFLMYFCEDYGQYIIGKTA
jgi:hypothetical protein